MHVDIIVFMEVSIKVATLAALRSDALPSLLQLLLQGTTTACAVVSKQPVCNGKGTKPNPHKQQ